MTQKIVPESGRELLESPLAGIVGDGVLTYTVDLGSTVGIDSNCWMHAWKGTTDVSVTGIPPGNVGVLSGGNGGSYTYMSANGNILTLPTISNELAAEYRYTFKVMVNGQYLVFYFRRKVERESGIK